MTKHRTTAARKSLERARRLPLVAAALAIFGPTGAHAGNLPVTSCTDAGPTDIGNLRHVVAAAGNGDTVDMTGLSCSTITLLLGEIVIQQDTLAIKGPGEYTLAIDAQQSRVFNHAGSGTPAITPTLTVSDLTMAYGYANEASSPANRGGCVYAKGNVALHNVYVYSCGVHTLVQDATAAGGGIFTHGSLMLDHSTLGFNGAFSTGSSSLFGNYGEGGGAYAVAGATITYSTIRNNGAYGVTVNGFGGSRGAGMYIKGGTVKVQNSTIYGNRASHRDGGMTIVNADVTVINSTISGNWAKGGTSGGMRCTNCTAKIYNSTIAFNKAAFGYAAAGLVVYNSSASTVKLQGVLLAENSVDADGSQYDWLSMGNSVIGSNNLIHATGSPVPSGTLTGVAGCPLLGPLRDNGGPTWTHALLSGSPGIDAGTVPPGNDQRGAPFVRVSGTKADIGAYEVQKADIVYNSAFDGCT